jgi:hypothetical protein
VTLAEAAPFLKYRQRELLFREGVLAFLGAGEAEEKEKRDEADYQAAVAMQERLKAQGGTE